MCQISSNHMLVLFSVSWLEVVGTNAACCWLSVCQIMGREFQCLANHVCETPLKDYLY